MTTTEAARSSSSNSHSTDAHLLVVEDDSSVAELLATTLTSRGYQTRTAGSAREAHELVSVRAPDLVLLDLGLPDRDGLELCAELRRWFRNPIIVITADGDERRKVEALDLGADDYVTKPFSMPELLARVRVALRHRELLAAVVDAGEMHVGDLSIDTGAHVAHVGDTAMALTRKEFELLALLARNPGRLLTHSTILTQVWGPDSGTTESLRVHLTNVRKKLGEGPDRPRIETAPGVGYRLVAADPSSGKDETPP